MITKLIKKRKIRKELNLISVTLHEHHNGKLKLSEEEFKAYSERYLELLILSYV